MTIRLIVLDRWLLKLLIRAYSESLVHSYWKPQTRHTFANVCYTTRHGALMSSGFSEAHSYIIMLLYQGWLRFYHSVNGLGYLTFIAISEF